MQPFSQKIAENNWNQSLPVTMNEFLTPLYWNFGPLFFCKLLQVIQIWRMPSPNCCFEISPQVFYGIQIWTRFRLLAISELSITLFVTISECFLKCVSSHCPAGRPITSGGDAVFWHWPLHCAPKFFGNHQISWYISHSQGIQCQKQQSNPKTSLNLHHVCL